MTNAKTIGTVVAYTTLLGAAFGVGMYKGHALGHGQTVPAGVDIGLIAAPVVGGGLAAMVGMANEGIDYRDVPAAGAGIAMVLSAGVSALYGAAGTVGTAVAEGVGIGAGYLASKL